MAFDTVSQSEENSSKSRLLSQIISQQIPRMENNDSSAIPVENFRWREIQQKLHRTQDALFNIFQFMREGKNQFVHKFDASLKDLAVKCMFNEIRTVVEKSITDYPNNPLILLYDTAFQLGDF
uniref:Uncharacterized protein n=1 Tax=Romanomermis culicivorax TaxID=13658 RepID=A0A915J0R7_ROMCU